VIQADPASLSFLAKGKSRRIHVEKGQGKRQSKGKRQAKGRTPGFVCCRRLSDAKRISCRG